MTSLYMKDGGARRAVCAAVLANSIFWCWFWIDIASRLEPYKQGPLRFEEAVPAYIFLGQALPFPQDYTARSLRSMRTLHWPSDKLSIWASWAAVRRFGLVEITPDRVETIGGISVAGYQLVLTMILSYVQWVGVAIGLIALLHRLRISRQSNSL